jgi:hypothetical protein
MKTKGWKTVEVKQTVLDAFNVDIQNELQKTAWAAHDGSSWYKNEAGVITANWPYSVWHFCRLLRSANLSDFDFK